MINDQSIAIDYLTIKRIIQDNNDNRMKMANNN